MKKIIVMASVLLLVTGFSYCQTENPKEVLFNKLIERYKNVNEMSAVVEMNMSMMGTTMKMPMKMWMKGNMFRMDMSMVVPGTDKNMEQIMIGDEKTVSIYNNLNNSIMTIDLNKLPEETRKMVKSQYFSKSMGFDAEMFGKVKDCLSVEEIARNDRKLYLITLDDINAIRNSLNMPPGAAQIPFKKLVYMIDYNTLIPVKIEIYTEGNTPGVWMDFIELKTTGVQDSIFNVKFPSDTKKIDITDSVKASLGK